MDNKDEKKGFMGGVVKVLNMATDIGGKAVESVQKSAKAFSEKRKNENYNRRMKKFNPLFPADFFSEDFNMPNMIIIVDDAVRRNIDVCEGAIGWTTLEKDIEVLHLYDEFVNESQIQFVPYAECKSIYYVDKFDRKRFIRIDCIFGTAHNERLAELKHIAHMLGAKRCSIEVRESYSEGQSANVNQKASFSDGKENITASVENSTQSAKSENRLGRIVAEFAGSDIPKRPDLHWFAHDNNIKNLIEMRCVDANSIKSEILELEGSTSATMSQNTAKAINYAMSQMGSKTNFNVEKKANQEQQSKLIFNVEF